MGRPRKAPTRLPALLQEFLTEDLETPGTFFAWEQFALWVERERFAVADGTAHAWLRGLRWSEILATPGGACRPYIAHATALDVLRGLQKAVRRAAWDVKNYSVHADIITEHLPAIRAIWFGWDGQRPVTPRLEFCPLSPDAPEKEMERWLAEQASSFGFLGGWSPDWRPAWIRRPAPLPVPGLAVPEVTPQFAGLARYWRRLEITPTHQLREHVERLAALPEPYCRVGGRVCATAMRWLGDLGERVCHFCSEPLPPDSTARREVCPGSCGKYLSRARRRSSPL